MSRPALTPVNAEPARLLDQVRETIAAQRYGAEYQPIVCTRSGDITGYEALARFFDADGRALPPQLVFEAMHEDPALLSRAECDLKHLQMDHAPDGVDLFLNLDPHALAARDAAHGPALLQRLLRTPRVVVELIENTDVHDASAGLALHRELSGHGVRTALDDIGAPHSLLSLDLIAAVDFLKFDRSWFERLKHTNGELMFRAMLAFARNCGRITVLEGVETDAMRDQAREYGLDRQQGFLYRALFRSVRP